MGLSGDFCLNRCLQPAHHPTTYPQRFQEDRSHPRLQFLGENIRTAIPALQPRFKVLYKSRRRRYQEEQDERGCADAYADFRMGQR
jgi:hypothetical protein